jgi:hypothetical protein
MDRGFQENQLKQAACCVKSAFSDQGAILRHCAEHRVARARVRASARGKKRAETLNGKGRPGSKRSRDAYKGRI